MPTGVNAMALAYRPDVAAEAGVEIPMEMTWSQFLDASKTVYEKTGWKSLWASECSSTGVEHSLRNNGLEFFNEDGSALGFDDPSYIVNVWQRALDAIDAGYANDVDEIAVSGSDCFVENTWVYALWTNAFGAYETDSGCELQMMNLVAEDNAIAPANWLKPTLYWAATAGSDVEDLAVEFINFFVNDTDVYDIVGTDRGIPIDADVKAYMDGKLEGASAKTNAFIAYLGEGDRTGSLVMDLSPAAAEVRELLNEYTQQVLYRVATDLEQTATDFINEANDILAAAG